MSIEQLKNNWEKFEQRIFPDSLRGKSLVGTSLVMLHSDAASAVIATVQTNGQVSSRIRNQLNNAIESLKAVCDEIDGESKIYFQDLLTLTRQAQKLLSS